MKNVPKILLRTYLRRRPVHIRMAQFNFLARYGWLKNLLQDLRPELFPPEPEAVEEAEPAEVVDEAAIAAHLIHAEVRGRQGIYQVERWLGRRGQGHLFAAVKLGAQQPVVLKEFLLPGRVFNPMEARQRQQQFVSLAGLARTDGRSQDARVIQPEDAIADTFSVERCYLITDPRDASPTLRQRLRDLGAWSPEEVRQLLDQGLQSLLHLHQQAVMLPSGQRQFGLVHGNLSLDSLLWVEYAPNRGFVYLTDLALWERIFDPPTAERFSVAVTPAAVSRDLVALGAVAYALLTEQETIPADLPLADLEIPQADPYLAAFVERLLTPAAFSSAEAAWQQLLALPRLTPAEREKLTPEVASEVPARRLPRWPIAAAGVAILLVGGTLWWWRLSRRQAPAQAIAPVCCLEEVGAVPAGDYVYTGVGTGIWDYVLSQENLGQRGQTLKSALQQAQPELSLTYIPAESVAAAIAAVQRGDAEFAILPRFAELEIPSELAADAIAHDGLAVFVAFSYVERNRGLPQALGGDLSVAQLSDLYIGEVETWRDLSRTWLPVKRYAPQNIEALQLFEQQVLDPLSLTRIPELEVLPTFPMLRSILQDFESEQLGSIGFAPLSQVFGQCSVYPLAIKGETGEAVPPLIFGDGSAITPNVDLCDRKGVYFPNAAALQTGEYPLAYEIIVLFPQNNSRVPIGPKFVELLRTTEGQQLLRAAGLVPLNGATP